MKQVSFLLFLFLCSFCSFAQPFHIGVFAGASNYLGDLADKAYAKKQTRLALGLTGGYDITDHFMLRGGLTFANVSGADKLSSKEYLQKRNLNFESRITEFSLLGEYTTFDLTVQKWSPYVFGGLALYHFNPFTYTATNQKVYLQPLSTEGEGLPGYPDRKPYSLTQLAIPFGGGIKIAISDNVNLGLEVGLRKLFTDYLDDLSTNYADATDLLQAKGPLAVELAYRGGEIPGGDPNYPAKNAKRGTPTRNDWYYFTGLHLSFRLGAGNNGGGRTLGGGRHSGYGCPANPM